MPRKSHYPSTPEIDAMNVSRQRKLQLRAKHAGICSNCFKAPSSPGYASGLCVNCLEKFRNYMRKKQSCKNPQPHTMYPKNEIIYKAVSDEPIDTFRCKQKTQEMADKLQCPVAYINYIRRARLGIKLQRGRPKNAILELSQNTPTLAQSEGGKTSTMEKTNE